ncbi:MAG: hypothetical protein HZB61_02700 [Nitrospirae bacterium]|nr:hypothetical protein [Nitrospirota bacterium]
MKKSFYLVFVIIIFLTYACGGGGGGSSLPKSGDTVGGSTGDSTGGGTGATAPSSVNAVATPATITVQGTSSVSVTVLDSTGANVPDGTVVTFSTTSGSITPQATTANGVATATFTAGSTAGNITITATAGSKSDPVTITISAPDTGSIMFTSATPSVIGIKGSGQTEVSLIKFSVKDINGNAVVDGTSVDFVMSGPGGGRLPSNGGEYIGDSDTSPTTASASTVSGVASVYLNSGMIAGPVIITATVAGTTMSSSSTTISIGGGVSNDAHLTLVTDKFNLEGLGWANIQANISVFMADRFGNYNVLQGTTVSFYSESGAIDRNDITDANGSTSVVFRTQNPIPYDVAPVAWENTLCNSLETTYGIDVYDAGTSKCKSGHPRDGWATIMVTTRGEEAFNDTNGNGMYGTGESFTDTSQEAYLDANDNDAWDDGSSDPEELYIDDNGNSTCQDTGNSSWDSDKTIFKSLNLLITGSPYYMDIAPNTITVPNAGSQSYKFLVTDINLNSPIGGTKVSISTSKGTLSGTTSYTFPDLPPDTNGPIELSFTLEDSNKTDTDLPEFTTITIKVTYKGVDYYLPVTGTVD